MAVLADHSTDGQPVKEYDDLLDFRSPKPHARFHDYLFRRAGLWNAIWGVIRASELKKTPLHGGYSASDQVLLGELLLRGKVHEVSDRLFFRRYHPEQSWRMNPSRKANALWFDTSNTRRIILPTKWKLFLEYLLAIRRARLSLCEQAWCYLYMMRWGFGRLVLKPLGLKLKWPQST